MSVNKNMNTECTRINCCQINLQKSRVATAELCKRKEKIFFLTEPSGKAKLRNDMRFFSADRLARAALQVEETLNPWLVEQFVERDICVVSVKIEGKDVFLCSLYLDILKEVTHPMFLAVVEHCNRLQIPLVIGADTNAHSLLWGSADWNNRGDELEEIILTSNLTIVNTGGVSTFVSTRAESVIDVTMINTSALNKLTVADWEVSLEPSLSDHRYVLFNIGHYSPEVKSFRNLRKADWQLFVEHLSNANLPPISSGGLDSCAEALEESIRRALNEAAPERPASSRPPNPWWTPELGQVNKELRDLHHKRTDSLEAAEAYKSLRNTYNKMIRRAKRDSWQNFVTKAESASEVSKIIKILRPSPQRGISLFSEQGEPVTPRETLVKLMDAHFLESVDISMDADDSGVRPAENQTQDEETEVFVNFITPQTVAMAFQSFGPLKAVGPDGFKPIVLQKLVGRFHEYISKCYQWTVRTGYVPQLWRRMKVVFLPKQGKSDYGQAKSYRPITLSNFILKGLERIIQWFLTDKLKPLYAQHAYTAGRSCESALSEVVDCIESSITRGEHALAVSLDCSGAFDRIKFASANIAMQHRQIPPGIRNLYMKILESRTVTANLQGEEIIRRPKRGSPQGGVLSPLIWILIMDSILTKFRGTGTNVFGYADDVFLVVRGKDPGTLVNIMNRSLQRVIGWGKQNGLLFNPDKTSCVRFSLCKRFSTWNKVKMDGKALSYSDRMKYLGVTLQRSLSWRLHVAERVQKAKKIMNLAQSVIGQKWGLNPQRSLWVYTAMARPVVLYGSVVWAAEMTDATKSLLRGLQRKAMLCMTNCMRSTPTAGLEVVLGILPLDLQAQQMAVKGRIRTKAVSRTRWDGCGKTRCGHRRILDQIIDKMLPRAATLDLAQRTRNWDRGNDDIMSPDLLVYTDGSMMEGSTGAGWAVCTADTIVHEQSIGLGKCSSVFQAEVIAIQKALEWCTKNCPDGTEILIRSDSQSAIQAVLGFESKSTTVASCARMLRRAKENLRIAITWIKGHADYTGNELADCLAKTGTKQEVHWVPPVPLSDLYYKIHQFFLARWQTRWQDIKTCRQTKAFFPQVGTAKLRKLAHWRRESLNLLVQAGTGHALVAHHLGQWHKDIEDKCLLCFGGPETTMHLYDECPALAMQQMRREQLPTERTIEEKILDFFSNETTLVNLFRTRSNQISDWE